MLCKVRGLGPSCVGGVDHELSTFSPSKYLLFFWIHESRCLSNAQVECFGSFWSNVSKGASVVTPFSIDPSGTSFCFLEAPSTRQKQPSYQAAKPLKKHQNGRGNAPGTGCRRALSKMRSLQQSYWGDWDSSGSLKTNRGLCYGGSLFLVVTRCYGDPRRFVLWLLRVVLIHVIALWSQSCNSDGPFWNAVSKTVQAWFWSHDFLAWLFPIKTNVGFLDAFGGLPLLSALLAIVIPNEKGMFLSSWAPGSLSFGDLWQDPSQGGGLEIGDGRIQDPVIAPESSPMSVVGMRFSHPLYARALAALALLLSLHVIYEGPEPSSLR